MKLHSFKFKGIDSREFDCVVDIPNMPPIAERAMETQEIPGRGIPLSRLNVTRKNVDIPITLRTFNAAKYDRLNAWLQGSGDLILSTDPEKKYHAYVHSPITPGRLSGRFANYPIIFTAEPFRYSIRNPYISPENPLIGREIDFSDPIAATVLHIYVDGSAGGEPLIFINFAGKLQMRFNLDEPFTVRTKTHLITYEDSSQMESDHLEYEYENASYLIDCAAKIVTDGENNVVTNMTSGRFPSLKHGENTISLEFVKEFSTVRTVGMGLRVFDLKTNERWY
ncbi:MAG: hypothetical protein NC320_09105 [Clostridium sp.]|nr:hypothetical protein [Clostridium sp.]MCM1547915.1 hypothetical protein [Ruminococcus sp.]